METTIDRLKRIVASVVAVDDTSFEPSASLVEAFNADSLEILEISMGVEDEFAIEVPPDDMSNFTTVGDLVNYIESRVAKIPK